MMYFKSSIITFLFMLIAVIGMAQTEFDNNGETETVNGPKYISAHTKDKDTLYIADNSTGHILKEAWEISDTVSVNNTVQKPHILVVNPQRIAKLEVKRDGVIVHKEYENRNK